MRNPVSHIDPARYEELPDESLLVHERHLDRFNDRFAWLPMAERDRILEEAWFQGPEVYDQINPEDPDNEVTRIWQPRIQERSQRTLQYLKRECIRAKTSRLSQECVDAIPAVVDKLRGVVRRHTRAFLIAAGFATGLGVTWSILNSDPIPAAYAAEQASDGTNCQQP